MSKKDQTSPTSPTGPTEEQAQRLQEIEGKLLEVALEECDPDNWLTEEQAEEQAADLEFRAKEAEEMGCKDEAKELRAEAKDLRKNWKGQRYWEKKNATATVSLLTKLELYRQRLAEGRQPGKGAGQGGDEDEKMKAEIKEAEKKVQGRLSLVKKRAVC